MSTKTKILWAVDPFSDKATQLSLAKYLKAFGMHAEDIIEPVSVLSPDHLKVPLQAFKEKHQDFSLEADKILSKWMKTLSLKGLVKHSLIVCNEYSRRKSVATLLEYAETEGSELIALTTHARKGVMRFLLGSFAETLLLKARIPLLIANPKSKLPSKIKKILFPTDFSQASKEGYNKILDLAKQLQSKLILYHKVEYVIAETYPMIYQTAAYEKYLEEDVAQRRKVAEVWAEQAKAAGISIEVVFDRSPSFVSRAISKSAKKHKVDLLAVVSSTNEASTLLLGSITRQLFRESPCPIWAFHYFQKK